MPHKNNKLLLIAGLIIVSILSAFYLYLSQAKKLTKQPLTPPLTDPSLANLQISNYSFVKDINFSTPQNPLNIYQLKAKEISLSNLANELANYFKLTPKIGSLDVWTSDDEIELLYIDKKPDRLTYEIDGINSPQSLSGKFDPSLNESLISVDKFRQEVSFLKDLVVNLDNISYYQSDGAQIVSTNSNTANIIGITLHQQIDRIAIYKLPNPSPPVEILVGQKNQIIKIIIEPYLFEISSTIKPNSPLLNTEEILHLLNANQAKIVFSSIEKPILNPLTVPAVEIYQINVNYLVNEEQQATPYYYMIGKNQQDNKQNITIVILPATKTP